MQWDDVRHFLVAARSGSFAAAGRSSRVEHTTIARRVTALEERMGTRLFQRTRTGLRLTAAGETLARRATAAEAHMREVERLAGTFDTDAAGEVLLATSTALAESLVVPFVGALNEAFPRIELKLVVARRLADLPGREADLALRLRPKGSAVAETDVVAIRLAEAAFGLYASSAYLRGRPPIAQDPARHRVLRYGSTGWEPGRGWLTSRAQAAATALSADDMPTVRAACIAGVGAAVLPHFYVGASPLRCIEQGLDLAGIFLAVHPDLRRTARVRAVTRWLKAAVSARLAETG